MFIDLRWMIFTAANLLLWLLTVLANGLLGPFGFSLFLYGLWPILPALRLRTWAGWASVAIPSLLFDAQLPVPFGFTFTVWTLVWMLVRLNRKHIRADSLPHLTIVAQVSNLIGFGAMVWLCLPMDHGYWVRLLADLLLSQATLLLAAPWFFAFENRLLGVLNLDIELREDAPKK